MTGKRYMPLTLSQTICGWGPQTATSAAWRSTTTDHRTCNMLRIWFARHAATQAAHTSGRDPTCHLKAETQRAGQTCERYVPSSPLWLFFTSSSSFFSRSNSGSP